MAGLSACANAEPSVSPPPAGASLAQWLEYFDGTGEADKIGEEQRQVLESAARTGELSYSDMTGLIELTFDCLEEQGLQPHWQDPDTDYGFPVPAYAITESAALGSAASQAVMDECANRYSALAEQLYIWQPKNAAIESAKWDREQRQAIVDCLRENGVDIDDDATRDEIEQAAIILNEPTGPSDNPVFGINCFRDP